MVLYKVYTVLTFLARKDKVSESCSAVVFLEQKWAQRVSVGAGGSHVYIHLCDYVAGTIALLL